MIITKKITFNCDLAKYGFPNSNLAFLVTSPSGWITSELFLSWLREIFLPEVETRRSLIGKWSAKAALVMDGHKTHVTDDVKALLDDNNVEVLIFPPHSSHLLQPLDLLVFGLWKKKIKQISFSEPLSSFSIKILQGIKALEMSSTSLDISIANRLY